MHICVFDPIDDDDDDDNDDDDDDGNKIFTFPAK